MEATPAEIWIHKSTTEKKYGIFFHSLNADNVSIAVIYTENGVLSRLFFVTQSELEKIREALKLLGYELC